MSDDTKPGYLTTEFYVSLIMGGAMLARAFGLIGDDQTTAVGEAATALAPALVVIAYVASRAYIKKQ
jgi:hypothetical protein